MPIPDEVTDEQAAGLLLQGLTAHACSITAPTSRRARPSSSRRPAAAPGASRCSSRSGPGAKVIALASSDEKRELARRLGADATADSRAEDLQAAILEANGGEKVDVVLHMSGPASRPSSSLAMLGRIVGFGNASRHPNEVATNYLLAEPRSRCRLLAGRAVRRRRGSDRRGIADLLGAVASGELEVVIGEHLPAERGCPRPRRNAGAPTTGKLLLDPSVMAETQTATSFADLGLSEGILGRPSTSSGMPSRPRSRPRRSPSCSTAMT